jgi:Ser/Thr protein kinase RdoA (MazF antagonist)
MAQKFSIDGHLVTVEPTGSGNVNDTFLAIFRTVFDENRFILQRVNGKVFSNPAAIMHNMCLVTSHVHEKLKAEQEGADRIWQLPKVIPAKDGSDFLQDGDGSTWRAISLIASARAYEKVQGVEHAFEAGTVLGQFQRLISDIPPSALKVTLPGFHITPGYLAKLDAALARDFGRDRAESSAESERCLDFINARREWCSVLEDAKAAGTLEARPIHGDPKISNIMIDDATGKGTCIIDLDTVMPGLVHYDFGDCMRSCCNPAGEEARDIRQVYFDTDLCEAILKGYMIHAGQFLSPADVSFLYDSIRLITFELGLRFYADFLSGDTYFKTSYDAHNLNRARVQFKLCQSIETRERQIRQLVDSLS